MVDVNRHPAIRPSQEDYSHARASQGTHFANPFELEYELAAIETTHLAEGVHIAGLGQLHQAADDDNNATARVVLPQCARQRWRPVHLARQDVLFLIQRNNEGEVAPLVWSLF